MRVLCHRVLSFQAKNSKERIWGTFVRHAKAAFCSLEGTSVSYQAILWHFPSLEMRQKRVQDARVFLRFPPLIHHWQHNLAARKHCVSTVWHYLCLSGSIQTWARMRSVEDCKRLITRNKLRRLAAWKWSAKHPLCFLSLSGVAETEKKKRFILKPFEADQAVYNRWNADLLLKRI